VTKSKEKIEKINAYLEEEYMLIHFDARKSGIIIPEHLKNNPTVTLKLSFRFQGGLEVTADRIWASLSFSGKFFDCYIPISAIWGATSSSGANTIWPEDAPPEVMIQVIQSLAVQQNKDLDTESKEKIKGVKSKRSLSALKEVVPIGAQKAKPIKKAKKPTTAKKKGEARPNHLKRIK